MIEGRLRTRSWQDQSGQKRFMTEIVAQGLQLGPRGVKTSSAPPEPPEKPSQENIPVIDKDKGNEEINVKDIPL